MPSEPKPPDDDAAHRALDLELAQKRAEWTRERGKFQNLRALSFGFLALVILGALLAIVFFFSRAQEIKEHRAAPAPSPISSASR